MFAYNAEQETRNLATANRSHVSDSAHVMNS